MTGLILFCLVAGASRVEADQSNRQAKYTGAGEVLAAPVKSEYKYNPGKNPTIAHKPKTSDGHLKHNSSLTPNCEFVNFSKVLK